MKNHLKFALAGVLALAALVSCKKEAQVEDSPFFNRDDNTVKTQFVLNVATSNTPTTKQSAATTQATTSETFRGMEEVSLLTYELGSNGLHLYNLDSDDKATAKRVYSLGQLLATGAISENNSRRVIELSLPVGTNTLLYYGKAPKGGATDAAAGKVTMNVQDNAKNTSFTISPRLTAENQTIFNESADIFATCMTLLSNAALKQYTAGQEGAKQTRDLRYAFYWPVNAASDVLNISSMSQAEKDALPANGAAGTGTHASQTFYIGDISWSELGAQYALNVDNDPNNNVNLRPLEEILGQANYELTTIRAGELRAGSGAAMQYLVTDIYAVAKRVSESIPSFPEGERAVLLAKRIMEIISTSFETSSTPLQYKSMSAIVSALETYVYGKSASNYSHVTDIATFPTNLGLPQGAAILSYDTNTKTWSYNTTNIAIFGSGGGAAVTKYLYPAELLYFGNSPVRVTDDAHETNHYPNTVANWDNDDTWAAGNLAGTTGWTKNGKVKSTTRSVAMQKDINYGTALFKTTVKYGAATLQDNNAAIQLARTGATESNATISVDGDTFRLTGVIIGGATNTVGWNFVNKGSTLDYMIYDTEVPNGTIPAGGTESDPVYTLVWDNWNSELANNLQSPVYIALEFFNNTVDFWGNANKVRKNGTFYLVGKLDPKNMTFPTRTATNYALPPYANDGTTIEASRVFIQDFMTSAVFSIGETSLQHAYVTVPDLRSSEITLGLSVDIKWETGLSFPNVVLGE